LRNSQALSYLLERGKTPVAFLGDRQEARRQGYFKAMEEYGKKEKAFSWQIEGHSLRTGGDAMKKRYWCHAGHIFILELVAFISLAYLFCLKPLGHFSIADIRRGWKLSGLFFSSSILSRSKYLGRSHAVIY
jgi:hypothetical protein